jgi:hypothetical protein
LDYRSASNGERIRALETRSEARADAFTGADGDRLEQRLQRQIDELKRAQ